MTKPKVAFFGITGCAGCQLSFIFNDTELLDMIKLIDIVNFPFLKEKAKTNQYDITFMEGLVANKEDLLTLKKVRSQSKILVALGTCAHTGCVPAYRRFTLKENFTHLLFQKDKKIKDLKPGPLDHHVEVDYILPGCPPDKNELKTFIKQLVLGKSPKFYEDPVCVECRKNGNFCLLDLDKPCLGSITNGGCNAVCINGNLECWGCRGPTKDANIKLLIELLQEKGFSKQFIIERMRIFAGLKHNDLGKLDSHIKKIIKE